MGRFCFRSKGPENTSLAGQALARFLSPGDVLAAFGELGTGKTCFAQGVALGLGISEYVTSPTFTLIQEYPGKMPFYHIDLYRLGAENDIETLDLGDYFYGDGVCFIEWPEIVMDSLPQQRLDIRFALGELENDRIIVFEPCGDRFEGIVQQLVSYLRGIGGVVDTCD
ncbi:MAG: tRNA (adenosine(37)-N6)-threonylcarbamoyltransferase complex ATPase subunit type 1 TsaE [Firmicutes bacterium]|nr:tRNA (adenosine(37)-N6)-threonylcarbamoyltransferase complex ATPase subunit type 1 TsaE [Bacillota bacterium]